MNSSPIGLAMLRAHVPTLGKMARDHDAALSLLLTLADSPLAVTTKRANDLDGALLDAEFRKKIGSVLLAVGKEKPETRKTSVPYLIGLAQFEGGGTSNGHKYANLQVRLVGISALAAFGPDAKPAMPALKKMNFDPSEEVRNAARAAIVAIEKEQK
jgi:hypothetical protein